MPVENPVWVFIYFVIGVGGVGIGDLDLMGWVAVWHITC
jgi:hypothetical protein